MKSFKEIQFAAGFCLLVWQMAPIQADDVRMYDRPPSADEVSKLLFGGQVQPSASSGGVKTRGINFKPKEKAPVEYIPTPSASARNRTGFGAPIEFGYNSSDIMPSSRSYIDSVGQAMSSPEAGGKTVFIEGHTDAKGSDYYNMSLSRERARAVKDYLVQNYGISPSRLVAEGKGETRPKYAPNDERNRRVEFYGEN